MKAPAPLSISDATTWAQAFLRRDGRLALPVAFALMGLPAAILDLFAPAPSSSDPAAVYQAVQARLLVGLVVALFALVGALAVSALALVPRISVGEALRVGFRRLPALIAATFIAGIGGGIIAILAGVLLFSITGVPTAASPSHTAFGVTVMMLAILTLIARLCLITPILVEERAGPIAALRRSWALTRGSFWRLIALLGMLLTTSAVVSLAVQSVTVLFAWLLGRTSAAAGIVEGVGTIVVALLGAVISMIFAVLLAAIYRQLASRGI